MLKEHTIKKLRKIQRIIKHRPQQFDMSYWFVRADNVPECGTAACIAGWALTIKQQEKSKKRLKPLLTFQTMRKELNVSSLTTIGSGYGTQIVYHAQDFLELTDEQARRLFFGYKWPAEFDSYSAKSAIKRIEHFIKTNGEE